MRWKKYWPERQQRVIGIVAQPKPSKFMAPMVPPRQKADKAFSSYIPRGALRRAFSELVGPDSGQAGSVLVQVVGTVETSGR